MNFGSSATWIAPVTFGSVAARTQREIGRRRDHATGRKRREPADLVHQADCVRRTSSAAACARILAKNTSKKLTEPAGEISRERPEGLRDSHVRKAQRELPQHVVELFAA